MNKKTFFKEKSFIKKANNLIKKRNRIDINKNDYLTGLQKL